MIMELNKHLLDRGLTNDRHCKLYKSVINGGAVAWHWVKLGVTINLQLSEVVHTHKNAH